jgi:23S rRNA pseudouridine2604 synthase
MRLYNILKNNYDLTKSELDDFMDTHEVLVNQIEASLITNVLENDILTIDGVKINTKLEYKYFEFYKPRGVVCSNNLNVDSNIKSYINLPFRVFPIGRLDKDSEGLLILTNDQAVCNKFLSLDNHIEKEYVVTLDKSYDDTFLYKMSKGVPVLGKITKECTLNRIDEKTFSIILKEGMNRQIRRMCKYFSYNVVRLKRVRFGKLKLDVEVGKIKEINLNMIE